MTSWKYVVHICLPPPLVLVLVLLLPLPRVLRKGIVMFVNNLLEFTMFGGVRLVQFMTGMTGLVFLGTVGSTIHLARQKLEGMLTPAQEINVRAKRWREERNFWIAFQAFFLWCVLWRLYGVMVQKLALEDRVHRLETELQGRRSSGTASTEEVSGGTGAPSPSETPSVKKRS